MPAGPCGYPGQPGRDARGLIVTPGDGRGVELLEDVAQGQKGSDAGKDHEIVGQGHGVGERDGEVFDLPVQHADRVDATVRVAASMDFLPTRHLATINPLACTKETMSTAPVDDSQ